MRDTSVSPTLEPATLLEVENLWLEKSVSQERQAPHPSRNSQVAAAFVADLPTWAARRLDPLLLGTEPLLAVQGERIAGVDVLAWRAGIRVGESFAHALQVLPSAQHWSHDAPAVQAAWDAAATTAYSFSPWVEVVNAGMLLAGGLNLFEAQALARTINARVGLANNRGNAQLAALAALEGGVHEVKGVNQFLAGVPIYFLRGLGFEEEILERLELFGIKHFADIRRLNLNEKKLVAQFGETGQRIYALANGIVAEPVGRYSEPPEIKCEVELEEGAIEPGEYLPYLELLSGQVAEEIGSKVAWTITVAITGVLGRNLGRRVLGAPTNAPKSIFRVAQLIVDDVHKVGSRVEKLELILGQLSFPPSHQNTLFGSFNRYSVQQAIRGVDRRFPGSIGKIELMPYGYLPEDRWRYVALGPSQERRIGKGKKVI